MGKAFGRSSKMRRQRDRAKRFGQAIPDHAEETMVPEEGEGAEAESEIEEEEGSSDEERTAYSKLVSSLMQDKGSHNTAQRKRKLAEAIGVVEEDPESDEDEENEEDEDEDEAEDEEGGGEGEELEWEEEEEGSDEEGSEEAEGGEDEDGEDADDADEDGDESDREGDHAELLAEGGEDSDEEDREAAAARARDRGSARDGFERHFQDAAIDEALVARGLQARNEAKWRKRELAGLPHGALWRAGPSGPAEPPAPLEEGEPLCGAGRAAGGRGAGVSRDLAERFKAMVAAKGARGGGADEQGDRAAPARATASGLTALQRALLPLLSEYVDLQLTDRTAADGEQVGALLSLHPPSSSPSPSPLSNTLPPLSPTLRLSRAICRVSCEGAVGGAPLPSVSRTDASARAAILVKADPRSARAPRPEPRDAFARDSAGAPPAPFRSCADASAPVWAATALSYERG
jgi:hypothetical protein